MQRYQRHVLPVAVAGLTIALVLAALLMPLPIPFASEVTGTASAPTEHHIQLNARMFAFDPGRLRVKQGDRVTITLVSQDVVHGLYVDGYDINIQAEPGKPAQVSFVADRLGKFRFRCSVTCGAMHPFMIGELVVGPNIPLWRAAAALIVVALGSLVVLRVHPKTAPAPRLRVRESARGRASEQVLG